MCVCMCVHAYVYMCLHVWGKFRRVSVGVCKKEVDIRVPLLISFHFIYLCKFHFIRVETACAHPSIGPPDRVVSNAVGLGRRSIRG